MDFVKKIEFYRQKKKKIHKLIPLTQKTQLQIAQVSSSIKQNFTKF